MKVYLCDLVEIFYERDGGTSKYMVKTFLSYYLSWYVLPRDPEDVLNT